MKIVFLKIIFLLPLILFACSGSSNDIEEVEKEVIKHSDAKTVNQVSPSKENLAKELSATCSLDSQKFKIFCESHRTAVKSSLKWTYKDRWDGKDNFEFEIYSPVEAKTLVILQECIENSCNEIEIIVDTSELVTDSKNTGKDQQHGDSKVLPSKENLAKELSATCSLDSQKSKIFCESHRTAVKSSLKWTYQNRSTGNDNFEFELHSPVEAKTLVILQECIENSCNEIEIIVDTSGVVTDSKNTDKDQHQDDGQSLTLNKKNKDGSPIKLHEVVHKYAGSWGRHCEGSGPVSFANSPMNPDDIKFMTPYGQVVGAHITPIDHMYFEPFNRDLGPDIYEVRAIQDGIIYEIGKREIMTDTGEKKDFADWRLDIAHNCTFTSYFDLMTSVLPEIEKAYEDKNSGKEFNGLIIKAGQLLGYVGGQTLDFGVYDYEIVLPGFITPSIYGNEYWKVHTVDPFQYFPKEISKKLLKKMLRTIKPQAGKIDYDIDGTLSGNWFEQGTNGYSGNNWQNYWIGHLSVAPHELDPSYWRVGIGHLEVYDNAFLIKGNIDPVKVKVNSGTVIYELYQEKKYKNDYNYEWWVEPKKEDDVYGVQYWGDSKGIIMFQMLENRLLKSEVFIGKSKDDTVDFTENAKLYER